MKDIDVWREKVLLRHFGRNWRK